MEETHMSYSEKMQFNIYIPKQYRDQLNRIAAQRILDDPATKTSGASVAVEIISEYLQKLNDEN
jgi:hypothetical protein